MSKRFDQVGLVGRFKPLHNGGHAMLEAVCEQSEHVLIGIGSSNRYDVRNPFTAYETQGMIESALHFDNYEIVHVPDFGHTTEGEDGMQWRQYLVDHLDVETFVTGNPYVSELLRNDFEMVHPSELMEQTGIQGTQVRLEMARGGEWKEMIPAAVSDYLERNDLVNRFTREFGSETIHQYGAIDFSVVPDVYAEQNRIRTL